MKYIFGYRTAAVEFISKYFVELLILLFGSAVLFSLFVIDPYSPMIVECAFKSWTGLSCPTCGITRSMFSLLHFNFVDAFIFNPFGVLIVLMFFTVLIRTVYSIINDRKTAILPRFLRNRIIWKTIFISWILFWLVRLIYELLFMGN